MRKSSDAEILALMALAFVAAEERLLARFLALSGLSLEALRGGAAGRDVQAAVLDFLAANEADLIACAAAIGVDPPRLAAARAELGACVH